MPIIRRPWGGDACHVSDFLRTHHNSPVKYGEGARRKSVRRPPRAWSCGQANSGGIRIRGRGLFSLWSRQRLRAGDGKWLDSLGGEPTPGEIYEHFTCVTPVKSGQIPVMPFEGSPNVPGGGLSDYGKDSAPSLRAASNREENRIADLSLPMAARTLQAIVIRYQSFGFV